MIQPNELRIGNWVKINGVNLIVTPELFCLIISGDIAPPKPIPITPEILEKAGFYKEEGTIECWTKNDPEFSICKTLGEGFLFCQLSCDTVSIIGKSKIEYLHQLQNLYFALTGQELPINNLNTTK